MLQVQAVCEHAQVNKPTFIFLTFGINVEMWNYWYIIGIPLVYHIWYKCGYKCVKYCDIKLAFSL